MKPRIPATPQGLSQEAAAWWKAILADFALEGSSLLILEHALHAFDRVLEARKVLAKDGLTCTNRHNELRAHPLVAIERDARGQLARLLRQLGLDLEPLNDAAGRPPGK